MIANHDWQIFQFRRWHFQWLAAKGPSAEGFNLAVSDELLGYLESQNSWTGVVNGDPVVCAGTIQHWPGRHQAWAYFGQGAGTHMLRALRAMDANLAKIRGRIEMTVRADFTKGQRWAQLLGFSVETPVLKNYGPLGEDHTGYVRIQP